MAGMSCDRDGDVLLIELVAGADGPEIEGEEVSPGVMPVYDGDGRRIGVEITAASKTLDRVRSTICQPWRDCREQVEIFDPLNSGK